MVAVVGSLLLVAPGTATELDCSNLPSTSDLRAVRGVEGTPVTLAAPSSYYPGCDEPGDPLTIEVAWGDGTSSPGRIEPNPGQPRNFTVRAEHAYQRPASGLRIVISQRNERTGVTRRIGTTSPTSPPRSRW